MRKRLIIILLCCLLNGCGFHLRSPAAYPSQLRPIYFTSNKPYSPLSIQMHMLFQSMKAPVVTMPSDATFSINITRDHFAFSQPDIVNVTLPTSISFIQSANVAIENNKTHQTIASHYFETSTSITLNANQIYTPNFNNDVRKELNHELQILIYYWLISDDTKDAIQKSLYPPMKKHATHTKTT